VSRDGRLVFVAKTARTFCYGFLGVLFPVYLAERGMDAPQIGMAVTLTLLASAAMTFAIRRPAERYGARAALFAQAGLIVVSAVVFLATEQPWLIVVAAMVGNRDAMDGFARVMAGVTSPAEFFSEENAGRILAAAR